MRKLFSAADIMMPDFISNREMAEKWAVVACDQYTSEPEYWHKVYKEVGDNPSSLHMILPEAFLAEQTDDRLSDISKHMLEYESSVLKTYFDSLIFVKRTVSGGKVRNGIVGKVDLEEYDYSVGSNSPIRATEGTVLERIPPRVAVRRKATIELPHIMLLIDDANKSVIESIGDKLSCEQKIYDFDLLFGGSIEGYLLNEKQKEELLSSLEGVFSKKADGISLAVGDGNHSLATAKARYEEIKKEIGEEKAKNHPLRYALCEVVNLHDDSLEFEPIYRLVKTNDACKLIDSLKDYGASCGCGNQTVTCIHNGNECEISLGAGTHSLTVGTLQRFLDEYIKNNPDVEIDYIHGIESIKKLSLGENSIGFVFEGMRKEELFDAVESDGALPRKTFSMGEAQDKRFYIECRKITE